MQFGWLLIEELQTGDWVYRVTEGTLVVGREPLADIRITHPTVSRKHATLTTDRSTCVIRDLDSQNGTLLNGVAVKNAVVRIGDRIQFGAIVAQVVADLDGALRGLRDVGSTRDQAVSEKKLRRQVDLLTEAQLRVLHWLLRGLAEKHIAFELELSPHTVHTHVKQIYSTLEVRSRPELMAKYGMIWEQV